MDMLINISKKNKKQFKRHNEKIDNAAFYEFGKSSNERLVIEIDAPTDQDPLEVKKAKENFKSIFNISINESDENANLVVEEIKEILDRIITKYNPLKSDYSSSIFGKHFIKYVDTLNDMKNTRDEERLFDKLSDKKDELITLRDCCEELSEFVENQYKNYQVIEEFNSRNYHNLINIEDSESSIKAGKLNDYFNQDDMPHNSFPEMKMIYEELRKAINSQKDSLRKQAASIYEDVYKVVEKSVTDSGVTEKNIYPNKDETLNKIKAEEDIAALQLLISKAPETQASWLKVVIDKTGKKTL